MEAKARGAKVIHVDPRFTRTSAVADLHVPLRAGSDIAFLGGIVNYIVTNERYFREYVVAYTNAATILRDDFQDTEDLDGLFSAQETWAYAGAEQTVHHSEAHEGASHQEGEHFDHNAVASALRVPGVEAALLAVHARDGGRRVRRVGVVVSRGVRGAV